jgi:hypothetical protein
MTEMCCDLGRIFFEEILNSIHLLSTSGVDCYVLIFILVEKQSTKDGRFFFVFCYIK